MTKAQLALLVELAADRVVSGEAATTTHHAWLGDDGWPRVTWFDYWGGKYVPRQTRVELREAAPGDDGHDLFSEPVERCPECGNSLGAGAELRDDRTATDRGTAGERCLGGCATCVAWIEREMEAA